MSSCTDLVVFSLSSPFANNLVAEERIYDFNGTIIKVKQSWKPDGKGGSSLGFGCSLYDGSFALLHFCKMNSDLFRNKTILELGCGTGFLSIALSLLRK
jgi:hypothetical protein